jgi:hypothetical protein
MFSLRFIKKFWKNNDFKKYNNLSKLEIIYNKEIFKIEINFFLNKSLFLMIIKEFCLWLIMIIRIISVC